MSAFLEALRERAAARRPRLVFPEGGDDRVLQAVARLQLGNYAQPVVLGKSAAVRRAVEAQGADAGSIQVLDPVTDERREAFADTLLRLRAHRGLTREQAHELAAEPLIFAALLVRENVVAGGVAGAHYATADVLRAALWCIGTAPGIATVSSAFYMVVPPLEGEQLPAVLTFTDAGVVPDPSADQLTDIAVAAAEARAHIVGDEPRVAFLSYATKGSAGGPSVARVRTACEQFRRRRPDLHADGELQADAALLADVRARKAPDSPLMGAANVLVFPDLNAGNIAYKLVQRLARAEAIGPILQGVARPWNDLSRGASVDDIVNVACVTAL